MLNIHLLHELTTTRPTEHYLHPPPPPQPSHTSPLLVCGHSPSSHTEYPCVFISSYASGGNACVLFVCRVEFCPLVLYDCEIFKKKKKKLFFCHLVSLSSLIARAFYKITSKPKNEIPVRVSRMRIHPDQSAEHQNESIIQQHAQSKPHEEETRAHQGWISGLMIPVDQSLCVVPSGLHALILRCQCSIS